MAGSTAARKDIETPSLFQGLLSQLRNEHEREVQALRFELAQVCARAATKNEQVDTANDSKLAHEDLPSDSIEEAGAEISQVRPFRLKSAYTQMPMASEVWGVDVEYEMQSSLTTMQLNGRLSIPLKTLQRARSSLRLRVNDKLLNYSIHPNSAVRVYWDMVSMSLLLYDLICVPLLLAFEPGEGLGVIVMAWCTLLFWTLDIFISVMTGYYDREDLVMDRKRIVVNYLQGWFAVDCVVVIPDWLLKILEYKGAHGQVTHFGRSLRVMRGLRLLRLLKLRRIFAQVYDLIDSEYAFIVFGLCKMLSALLVLNHFVACIWFALGRSTMGHYDKNWLEHVGLTPVEGTDLSWQYATSLHWAITQFTPASMDVYATNLPERAFSIVVLFWALVAVSSLIANVTASVTTLRQMANDEMKQMWMLRRYLRSRRISNQLMDKTLKYAEWVQLTHRLVVREEQVVLLKKLTPVLRAQLLAELGEGVVSCHPFFDFLFLNIGIRTTSNRICDQALTFSSYAEGDICFAAEDESVAMYFIHRGEFDYILTSTRAVLEQQSWLSEAALWTAWQHRGTCSARIPGDLCSVGPGPFAEVLRVHPRTFHFGRDYGTSFVDFLNSNSAALTDVVLQCECFNNMESYDSYNDLKQYKNATSLEGNPDGERNTVTSHARRRVSDL